MEEEREYSCRYCKDTGVIDIMEPVYTDDESIQAPIGERVCDCQVTDEDYETEE